MPHGRAGRFLQKPHGGAQNRIVFRLFLIIFVWRKYDNANKNQLRDYMLPEPARLAVIPEGNFPSNYACPAAWRLACSRLRDSGEMSFSKKKCEKRAGAGKRPPPPFPSRARLIFALLVLKYVPIILSESLEQATRWLANEPSEKQDSG